MGVFVPAGTPAAIVDGLNARSATRSLILSGTVFLKPTKSRSAAAARSLPGSHTKSMKNAGAGTR